MKFAVLVDYANLFITVKETKGLKKPEDVEKEIHRIFSALQKKLEQPHTFGKRKKVIETVAFVCYVLDLPSFGNPEAAYRDLNIKVKRIQPTGKTDKMKIMNQSQDDDSVLMKDGSALALKGGIDGILLLSHDGDFISLGEQLDQMGKLFWIGTYEVTQRASRMLRNRANVVLPLHEIVEDIEEGQAIPEEEIVADEEIITGPHLEIFYRKQVILRYPIYKTPITLGRRSASLFHYPQVDLTEFDREKVVSRRHATITPIGNRLLFAVDSNCTRGTWRDQKRVYRGEQFFFEPDMKIVIGSSKGFGIRYRLQ